MQLEVDASAYLTLGERLRAIHDRLLEVTPDVARIACALYDADRDMLRTFINSTREGRVLRAYEYRLSDSESLSTLARTRELRLLEDLPHQLAPTTAHSAYVLDEGYLSSLTIPMVYQGTFLGFLFFDSRVRGTFTPQVQRDLVLYANLLTLAVANEFMAARSLLGTIRVARDITRLRDPETGEHLDRMARYAKIIGTALAEPWDLTDEFVEHLFLYAPLHDIGKIAIPDAVLFKPGPLTEDEWRVMKTHTTVGRAMVDRIVADLGLEQATDSVTMRHIVELHHEALDGSGYPHGLRGDEIPVEARIVTVADVFDAVTSARTYRRPWSVDRAFEHLDRLAAGGKVERECVDALRGAGEEVERIRQRYGDVDVPVTLGP